MPINTKNTFIELITLYNKNPEKFIFFVGAGLSQPLFPSWKNLLKIFLEQAQEGELSHPKSEILDFIEKGENYLDVAEVCVNAMGGNRYRDIMEEVFDKDFSEQEIPGSYKALMNLSPKGILTTNYDRIPEIAGKGKYRINTNKNAPEASRFFADNKNAVFKIHGDITDHSSIVLTNSDYRKIVNDNPSTRLLLNSLLSTKSLIFVGFSLSDPHIDTILNNIMSISNELPLSHYVLLNEQSSFKISSFERKYGVKVIAYTSSDGSHSEVIEFLRSLNTKIDNTLDKVQKNKNIEITTPDALVKYLGEIIKNQFSNSQISIFYFENNIHLSFTPSGETKSEIQKEFLSLFRLIDFSCLFVGNLVISAIEKNSPTSKFDESQQIIIRAVLSFSDANKFATKKISTSKIWELVNFYSFLKLSDVFRRNNKVDFSMSIGILGE